MLMHVLKISCFAFLLLSSARGWSQPSSPVIKERAPLAAVRAVADKTLRTVPFEFRAVLRRPDTLFRGLSTLNFGRTFGADAEGVAYARSVLVSDRATTIPLQISHNDGLAIWLNGTEIYRKNRPGPATLREEERDLYLDESVAINLRAGKNEILIKSLRTGTDDWKVHLRIAHPAAPEGQPRDDRWLRLDLGALPRVTQDVAELADWFVIGPFPALELAASFPPESEFVLGRLYAGRAWELPRVEIYADVIDADPNWGTLYDWNYHTAGYAWALYHLGEATGVQKYRDYLHRYCNFMLDIKPYVGYEKYTLHRPESRHSHLWNTPLLDFTAAPALPFAYRLLKESDFPERAAYRELVTEIQQYLATEQLRFPDGTFTRKTPFEYTTWADDMFMGVPFLLNSGKLAAEATDRQGFYDDAARQIIGINARLFDPELGLYPHAAYSERPEAALPHWSRANGWAVWATSEALLTLPQDHADYAKIMDIYRHHVAGIVRWQDADTGFFRNVLDYPESFFETSGTAIFTLAIARGVNEGWLDRVIYAPHALAGWRALDSIIATDGTVSQICMGTMCTEDLEYYRSRPVVKDDSHGLLGLIFAGLEVQRLLDAR